MKSGAASGGVHLSGYDAQDEDGEGEALYISYHIII